MLTPYKQVVNNLFETYPADDIIPQVEIETVPFTQPTRMSLLQYADGLWMKTLQCPQVHDEYIPKGTFWQRYAISI